MEVNKKIKSVNVKKILKKQNKPKLDKFIMKDDVERFGCNNLLQGFKFTKSVVKVTMDVC